MKKSLIILFALVLILSVCFMSTSAFAWDGYLDKNGYFTTRGDAPIPTFGPPSTPAVQNYWNTRHTIEQYEALYKYLAATYPQTVKYYPIGHTWEERTIWCVEIASNGTSEGKTPLSVVGNIHGGEQESAESTAYIAWWLAAGYAAGNAAALDALDGYVWYIIPILNVDGYARSMYANTRQNMRPRGIGYDEYFDRDGDGKVGAMYVGSSATNPPFNGSLSAPQTARYAADYPMNEIIDTNNNYLGREAFDTNNTGRFGSDTKASGIDMNRTFDYFWTLNRPANASSRADGYVALGASTWGSNMNSRTAGPGPASEPEIAAIQNFYTFTPPRALITGHTGSQDVFYPWCYTSARAADYTFMSATATAMRNAIQNTVRTVRPSNTNFGVNQSYNDYPTSAEMIDWTYGRLGTHSYTIEVWASGAWRSPATYTYPARWVYLGPVTDTTPNYGTRTYEHVWIYTSASNAGVGEAPIDQYILCEGIKDGALAMCHSEPRFTPHPGAPGWMKADWE